EKNRLRDSGGESPKHGIEGPNSIELRGSEPARGTEHKSRQPCRASLMHSMKSGGEAALAGDEIRPSFEDLCGHAGGCASRFAGEGSPHIKFSGGGLGCCALPPPPRPSPPPLPPPYTPPLPPSAP